MSRGEPERVDFTRYRVSVREDERRDTGAVEAVQSRLEQEATDPALRAAVRDTLEAYFSGSATDFQHLFQAYGIEPPPIMDSDPGYFERATSLFDGARIDPDALAVSARFVDGDARVGPGSSTARRDEARPFLRRSDVHTLRRMEVAIPGLYSGLDGTSFEGILRLRYLRDPRQAAWVICEVRIEGVPTGVPVSSPPL
jgi:hypothetical protein